MNKFIVFILLFFGVIFINQKISEPNREIISNERGGIIKVSAETIKEEPIFISQEIPNNIYEKMLGKSIPIEFKNDVDISTLSYLQVSYLGFDNNTHIGEIIVNSKIAEEVLNIFRELYDAKYPIEKIKLIDEYDANDELSMSDNNTSCFCYRTISGTKKISNHAKGLAIDINPLYNPYVTKYCVSPAIGILYVDRNVNNEYQINKNDFLYKTFTKYGWSWGGDWKNRKDYQHFEREI